MKGKTLILAMAAVLMVIGIGITVGGWVTNKDQVTIESEPSNETENATESVRETAEEGNASAKEEAKGQENKKEQTDEMVSVDKIAFNTDTPLSGITIELVNHIGNQMVFKVTNQSNVCYDYVDADVYFTCPPLPNRKPSDKEYHNSYNFMNIPAYSETYHVVHAFLEVMGKEGQDEKQGVSYYPFTLGSDPYRIIVGEEDLPMSAGYRVSDDLIQNAMDYVSVDQSTENLAKNKLGTASNRANRHVEFTAFAIVDEREIVILQNGNRHPDNTHKDSDYDNVLLAGDQVLEVYDHVEHDLRSLYTKPFDLEIRPDAQCRVFIGNAWFNDEIDDQLGTIGPKPTSSKQK